MKKVILILAASLLISPVIFAEEKKVDPQNASQTISENAGKPDKIDLPFVDDPDIVGEWKSIDFVNEISEFKPGEKQWKEDLYLKEMIFEKEGKTFKPFWTWTKNVIIHSGDKTASKYEIKEINGGKYMFFEWKSGDVILRGMKPRYYVLKKEDAK